MVDELEVEGVSVKGREEGKRPVDYVLVGNVIAPPRLSATALASCDKQRPTVAYAPLRDVLLERCYGVWRMSVVHDATLLTTNGRYTARVA